MECWHLKQHLAQTSHSENGKRENVTDGQHFFTFFSAKALKWDKTTRVTMKDGRKSSQDTGGIVSMQKSRLRK